MRVNKNRLNEVCNKIEREIPYNWTHYGLGYFKAEIPNKSTSDLINVLNSSNNDGQYTVTSEVKFVHVCKPVDFLTYIIKQKNAGLEVDLKGKGMIGREDQKGIFYTYGEIFPTSPKSVFDGATIRNPNGTIITKEAYLCYRCMKDSDPQMTTVLKLIRMNNN
jgi:hypothetical protein